MTLGIEEDAHIWRYMDVGRFLTLLDSRHLYFPRVHELKADPFEGTLPRQITEDLVKLKPDLPPGSFDPEELIGRVLKSACVSCWHEGRSESVAMWSLYCSGDEGIAIRSTVGGLRGAVRHPHELSINRVRYHDDFDSKEPQFPNKTVNQRPSPIFVKRESYQHEREVRAYLHPSIERVELLSMSVDDLIADDFPRRSGVLVPVDMDKLINRIVVSPRYPLWAVQPIQKVVSDAGLKITVETSDLIKEPPRRAVRAQISLGETMSQLPSISPSARSGE